MQLMYFTEQPMSTYPAAEGLKFGATALCSRTNSSIRSPAHGSITSIWNNDRHDLEGPVGFRLCRGSG